MEWPFKYKPQKFGEMVLHAETKRLLEAILNGPPQSFLLAGPPGVGKSCFVDIYLQGKDFLKINASMERSIDDVRDKINNYAQAMSLGVKYVYLNEMDNLTIHAQRALRDLQEKVADFTKFIYVCNFFDAVTEEIKSRCKIVIFQAPAIEDIGRRVLDILQKEKVKFKGQDVVDLVKDAYPDIRKTIHHLQLYSHNNVFKYKNGQLAKKSIMDVFLTRDPEKIREHIKGISPGEYREIYTELYDKLAELKNPVEAMLLIGEHAYRNDIVSMKEINFMAMVFKMLQRGVI